MSQNPPPIQWLPAFEAAARLLNFKQAAEELSVSPPAISQQIKVLESYLGVTLFDRSTKKLRLTEAGEFYYKNSSNIIKSHIRNHKEFERNFLKPTLQVSAPHFIAHELLIPNYTLFNEYAPGIELRLISENEYIDFESSNLDAALRFGLGNWPNLDCRFVSEVEPRIVCSPTYLGQHGLTKNTFMSKQELENHVLLTVFDDLRIWKSFYLDIESGDKILCDSCSTAMRSAEEGLGVAVGMKPLINRLVSHDRLTVLNSVQSNTDYSYWLVAPHNRASTKNIDALYRWIAAIFDSLK